MDKTKRSVRKIERMGRGGMLEVGRLACVCAAAWGAAAGSALAEPGGAEEHASSGLGLGGAYLFGALVGLLAFGIRYALQVRKAHLAEYGK